jgi:hypothetical protein
MPEVKVIEPVGERTGAPYLTSNSGPRNFESTTRRAAAISRDGRSWYAPSMLAAVVTIWSSGPVLSKRRAT